LFCFLLYFFYSKYKINISREINKEKLFIQIDRLSSNKKINDCKEIFDLNFGIFYRTKNRYKMINYFKNNKMIFDTSKIFIIKNGKKYKLNLQKPSDEMIKFIKKGKVLSDPIYKNDINFTDNDKKIDLSNIFLQKINRDSNNESFYTSEISNRFFIPFGCQALENTILIIDGISVNKKILEPIEIELTYNKK
jgi:hypothetical protein